MILRSARCIPATAALLLLAACYPAEPPGTVRLQGVWSGHGFGADDSAWTIEITGESFSAQGPEPKMWYRGRIELPGGGEPARIDFRILECDCPYRGKACAGIYEIEGNRLTLAAAEPGRERPNGFEKKTGQVAWLSRETSTACID